MSAIQKDAADISTPFPHPTGAATVINFHCVVPPFTTTPNPTAPASSSPSSPSASSLLYYSDPSSSSSSASPSRLAPRDFPLEQHQAEYRAHAYLANESIVKTKLAADKFLQNLFKTQTEPDKDILRAASAASRARLQNPFAYNNSRSSGSSGSSGSSSGSSSYYSSSSNSSSSSGSSNSRSSSSAPNSCSNPSNPQTHPQTPRPASPTPAPLAPAPTPADDDQPLTEADFTDCIKLEDIVGNTTTEEPPAVLARIGPDSSTAPATAAQPNPITPESTKAASTSKPASDLAIWQFDHLTISSSEAISPPQPPCLNLATRPFNQFKNSSHRPSWPLGP